MPDMSKDSMMTIYNEILESFFKSDPKDSLSSYSSSIIEKTLVLYKQIS